MRSSPILRWELGCPPLRATDELAPEEPLEIRVDDRPIAVTMRTPGHDDELAAGFLASEGLVHSREQVVKIASHPRNTERNVIGVFLADGVEIDFKSLARHTFVSSSCGLCGKASIESVRRQFPPIKKRMRVRAETLLALPDKLRGGQTVFARTGGLHAAGLFDAEGNLITLREDVGRHNAVDKVLGRAFLDGLLPLERHILVVSGRASFEIMQKALAGRLAVIAAVSAPSSLAVEFARASRQTLAGFVRGQRMNVYAGAARVIFPKNATRAGKKSG
ncbi:MAG TPA: formate dehydrogenase accessory sulfurtransferase FdhD [Verrucomicrobiae bacterium]|jgi:FdhD protein